MGEQEFGQRLRVLRHERAETLEDVSAATGLSVAMLSRVERGERLPSPESVEVLATHFGLPADELMSETIASRMHNRYGHELSSRAAEKMQGTWMADADFDEPSELAGDYAPRVMASGPADGPRLPMRTAGSAFSAQPIEALFDEDLVRDSLADAAHVAEVALESAMRAVRRAQASGDPQQVREAEQVLRRLRRAVG